MHLGRASQMNPRKWNLAFNFTGSEADGDVGKGRLWFPLWKLLSLFSGWLVKTIVCRGVSIIKEEEIACEWLQLVDQDQAGPLEGEIYQSHINCLLGWQTCPVKGPGVLISYSAGRPVTILLSKQPFTMCKQTPVGCGPVQLCGHTNLKFHCNKIVSFF